MSITVNVKQPEPAELPDSLTRKQVQKLIPCADALFYKIQRSDHPIPSHQTPAGVRFLRHEVLAWIASFPQAELGKPVTPRKGEKAA